jgi:dihydrofolate reductase
MQTTASGPVMRLSLVVAMTRAGVIGRGGGLPWRLSADLKRFKSLTMGHHIVMGRTTYESLGRLLPGRTAVIITRSAGYIPLFGGLVTSNLDESLCQCQGDAEPFVIGGGEIFRLALPRADRLYVTWVEAEVAGDTYFPSWNEAEWRLTRSERHSADARNEYDTTFCIYDRI